MLTKARDAVSTTEVVPVASKGEPRKNETNGKKASAAEENEEME